MSALRSALVTACAFLLTACSSSERRRGPAQAPRPAVAATILSSEPWTFGATPGRVLRTPHYRLFTTLPPSILRSRLPAFLEAALSEYRSRFLPLSAPQTLMDTYVVAGRDQWSRLAARLIGPQAAAFQTIPRGGLTAGGRAILYDIGTRDTFALSAHEGWHQFTQATFAHPLPTWLEEGLATTFEGFVWDPANPGLALFRPWANLERFDQLRTAAARGRLVPLEELLGAGPGDLAGKGSDAPLDYYAQVWALAMFLREGEGGRYRAGLGRLIADTAGGGSAGAEAGQTGLRAMFGAYFATDLPTMEQHFGRFVAGVVRAGARDQITRGESPLFE